MVRNNPKSGEVFSIKISDPDRFGSEKQKKQNRHGESSAGSVKIHAQIL